MKTVINSFISNRVVSIGKMKVLAYILPCFMFIATGCSINRQQINDEMALWEGCHYSKVIEAWGPPTQSLDDGKGGKILSWQSYSSFTLPGHASTTFSDFSRTAYTTYNPPRTHTIEKTETFWADPNGIIYNWSWTRNRKSGSKSLSGITHMPGD